MATETLQYDKRKKIIDDEYLPEGSMTVEEFGYMLKEGIREYYENKESNSSAANKG